MSKSEKLLHKAMNNPAGLNFEEFKTLLLHSGWISKRQKGSHETWYSPNGYRTSIQNHHGKAKRYQVEQFLVQYAMENENE